MSIRRTLSDMFEPPAPHTPDLPWPARSLATDIAQAQSVEMRVIYMRSAHINGRKAMRKRAKLARSLKPRPMEPR